MKKKIAAIIALSGFVLSGIGLAQSHHSVSIALILLLFTCSFALWKWSLY